MTQLKYRDAMKLCYRLLMKILLLLCSIITMFLPFKILMFRYDLIIFEFVIIRYDIAIFEFFHGIKTKLYKIKNFEALHVTCL